MGHGSGGRTGGHGARGRGRELSVDAPARAPRARQRGGLARQGREPDAGSAQGGGRGRGRHPRVRHVGASPGGRVRPASLIIGAPPAANPQHAAAQDGAAGRPRGPPPAHAKGSDHAACSGEGGPRRKRGVRPGPGHTLRPDGAGRGGRGGWRHPPSRTPRACGLPRGPALPVGLAPTSKPCPGDKALPGDGPSLSVHLHPVKRGGAVSLRGSGGLGAGAGWGFHR